MDALTSSPPTVVICDAMDTLMGREEHAIELFRGMIMIIMCISIQILYSSLSAFPAMVVPRIFCTHFREPHHAIYLIL